MPRVHLAGAAGVGKTTIAKILADRLDRPLVRVEAEECWALTAVARQACFLGSFTAQLRCAAYTSYSYIADNSIVTVYGYTRAVREMAERSTDIERWYADRLVEEAEDLAMIETGRASVIVLTASIDEIKSRIARRLVEEPSRERNVAETDWSLHEYAQEYILRLAERLDLPVIDTSGRSPEEVAGEIERMLKSGWRSLSG